MKETLVAPFDVLVRQVPDARVGHLLTDLTAQGFDPILMPAAVGAAANAGPAPRAVSAGLPDEWRLVRQLDGQSYAWPQLREPYERYRVFAGEVEGAGTAHIAIGEAARAQAWGKDRKYLIAFLTSGSPQVPLVEFLEVDDYESTHELLAVIRGRDGGKKMYGPGDALPEVYTERFRTELYRDRVVYPGSWGKLAVIAHEDDYPTILNHALLQARRRGDV